LALLSVRQAGLTLGLLLASACSAWEPASGPFGPEAMPPGWRTEVVLGGSPERRIIALRREPTQGPALFRLIVIPGSGCTGFAPFAGRYFNGLTKAQVIVLHKPYADLFAGPAPAGCSAEFVRNDALGSWRDDAIAALRQLPPGDAASLPAIVLGISEGAEIAPYLFPAISNPMGMVLLSATGLDPAVAGEMHAERSGQRAAWTRLKETSASSQPDGMIVEGRSLRYWRDMFGWKLTAALAETGLPLLRVWGSDDALLPQEAYDRFRSLPAATGMQICDWRLAEADHGLQGRRGDGVQLLWRQLERWAATGRLDCGNDMGRLR
jgi:pimeloyl-ACP methyl ester carboxylesterase